MQLSCWPRVGAAAVSFRGSRVYLALIHRQQRWQRHWLLALSLLVLSLFLLSLALGEFVLLPWQPLGELELRILLELRLPRALLALLAGELGPPVQRIFDLSFDAARQISA